ncbi:MAG: 4Fe-4S ferredoxin, partial [Thermoleophilia bacterium]|nr:4Fe-4S ferredoxin [Thermoleophilia bacterium]
EGALALDDEGKAVLVNEIYCDGMGVCLDVCPTGALKIVERETAEFDEEAGRQRAAALGKTTTSAPRPATTEETSPAGPKEIWSAGLEQTSSASFRETSPGSLTKTSSAPSELTQWPVQLHLVSPYAPYFRQAHLLVAADCTAFARGTFHQDLLRGRKLVVACPKLDDLTGYVVKLAELIRHND